MIGCYKRHKMNKIIPKMFYFSFPGLSKQLYFKVESVGFESNQSPESDFRSVTRLV